MRQSRKVSRIKPGINPKGFRTAVKDYSETTVIEELAANCYDASASTVLVLIDAEKSELHVIDDGLGFSRSAIRTAGILGGGEKKEVDFAQGQRPYLGAYGFGLKATLNIAKRVKIHTVSEDGQFEVELDWSRLEEGAMLLKDLNSLKHLYPTKREPGRMLLSS